MKNNKNNKFLLYAIPILSIFATTLAFASDQSFDSEAIDAFMNIAIDFENDYAQRWFRALFGDYIFQIFDPTGMSGGKATVLTYVVSMTNILALMLAVILISYTVIGGAVASAASGEMLGKAWSSLWVPVRTALGLGLIMPMKLGADAILSACQIFVLTLIMGGSAFGNFVWETALDKTFGKQNSTNGSDQIANFIQNDRTVLGLDQYKKIADQLICTEYYVRMRSSNYVDDNSKNGINRRTAAIAYDKKDQEIGRIVATMKYPANTGQMTIGKVDFSTLFKNPNMAKIEFADGKCGTVTKTSVEEMQEDLNHTSSAFEFFSSEPSQKDIFAAQASENFIKLLGDLYNEILPVVGAMSWNYSLAEEFPFKSSGLVPYHGLIEKLLKDPTDADSGTEKAVLLSYEATGLIINNIFQETSRGYVEQVVQSLNNSQSQKVKEDFMKGGWVVAGSFYHELTSAQDLIPRVMQDVIQNSIVEATFPFTKTDCYDSPIDRIKPWKWSDADACTSAYDEHSEVQRVLSTVFDDLLKLSRGGDPVSRFNTQIDLCKKDIASCKIETNISEQFGSYYAKQMLNALMTDYSTDNPLDDIGSGMTNPFRALAAMGHKANTGAGAMWLATGALYVGGESIEGISGGLADGGTGLTGVPFKAAAALTKWILTQLVLMLSILFSSGFILSFVLPFMPLLIWILAVCGYFLTAIEAVVAAPLAVVMMVVPEGDGISGSRMERAMQMVIAIVLKPTLLIIGLIASIGFGYIAFEILNTIFWQAAASTLDIHNMRSGAFDGAQVFTGLYGFFAVISIYTGLAYQVCQYTTHVIHKIPEQILEWISGGIARRFGEDNAQGTAEKAIGGIQQGSGQLINSSVKGAMSSIGSKIRSKKDNGGSSSDGGGLIKG